jgi:hypothetical protein
MMSGRVAGAAVVVLALVAGLGGEAQAPNETSSDMKGEGGGARSVPMYINYQGYLEDSLGGPIDDSLVLTFKIYEFPTSGDPLWAEGRGVTIENGVFDVVLGTYSYIPDSVFIGEENRWMELSVEGEVLWPRTMIGMVPYAYKAHVSDTANMAWNASYSYQAWTSYYSDTADYAYYAGHADTADYAFSGAGGGDTDWDLLGDVLYTHDHWGVARGGTLNKLWGANVHTHTNLGSGCTTGVSGLNNSYVTIAGGYLNEAKGGYSAIVGGKENEASGTYAMVGSGLNNTASEFGTFIGGGQDNEASGYEATVAGGRQNTASGDYAVIAGGISNEVTQDYATVGGGWLNSAEALYSSVSGGFKNVAQGNYSTIGGGREDTVKAPYCGVFSGYNNTVGDYIADSASVICGGRNNFVGSKYSIIGGGQFNIIEESYAMIGGGKSNDATGGLSVVSGGWLNSATGDYSTISGGDTHTASGPNSTICGGHQNSATEYSSTVSGGGNNTASANYSWIGGGYSNVASGYYAVVLGGWDNDASGDISYAFGYDANTDNIDSTAVFDWGSGKGTVFIGRDAISSTYRLYVSGSAYATGVWNSSDRTLKENVRPLESSLDLVSELNPVRYTWKEEMKEYGIDEASEDFGFIAQDLQQVLPEVVREMDDEGHLAVNYDHIIAVNTAAIQELLELVENQQERIEQLENRIADLER